MDGWKTIVLFWGPAYFQVLCVSFREGIQVIIYICQSPVPTRSKIPKGTSNLNFGNKARWQLAPENGWLEEDPFLLGIEPIFRGEMLLVLGRVTKRLTSGNTNLTDVITKLR